MMHSTRVYLRSWVGVKRGRLACEYPELARYATRTTAVPMVGSVTLYSTICGVGQIGIALET